MWKKLNLTKLFRSVSEFKQNFRFRSMGPMEEEIVDQQNNYNCNYNSNPNYNNYNRNCLANLLLNNNDASMFSKRFLSTTNVVFNWQAGIEDNKRRKVIPKLIYLHNPWKYMVTKFKLYKLRLFWDREFAEEEFIRGSKQAAVVLTDIIRTQNTGRVSQFTTPLGFQQITRDMLLSRNDARLKLIKFDTEHLRRAIPIQVATRTNFGQKYAFIDMLFVGLRNSQDFDTPEEVIEVKEILRQLDADMKTPLDVINVPHRIVFVEILIRFRRNYSDYADEVRVPSSAVDGRDWAVSFYKILTFDVLNYDPRN